MKRPGHCTLCDAPVFEMVNDRPTIPTEDAWRVNFLLSDDTNADITFCEKCLSNLQNKLDKVWEICLERFDYEERTQKEPSPERDALLAHLKELHIVQIQSETRWDSI